MEVFNLDDFSAYRKVVIKGQEYKISGLTVGEMLDGKIQERFTGIETVDQEIQRTIDYLLDATDIPADVLRGLKRRELDALFLISIGQDPGATEKASADAKKK